MEILSIFNTFTLKRIFGKAKAYFKKLEYRLLVESIKTENASFPFKTTISEANVKTNRMVSTKKPITKNGVLPVVGEAEGVWVNFGRTK